MEFTNPNFTFVSSEIFQTPKILPVLLLQVKPDQMEGRLGYI